MGEADMQVAQALEALPQLAASDRFLVWRGRFLTGTFLLEAGSQPYFLGIESGRLVEAAPGPILMRSWDFALRADAEAWVQHWQAMPRPGFHDIFAMSRLGRLRMEGSLHPLVANLQFIKDLVALPRRLAARPAA
jgi:hypothetical protein